jgi:hypothetical protein
MTNIFISKIRQKVLSLKMILQYGSNFENEIFDSLCIQISVFVIIIINHHPCPVPTIPIAMSFTFLLFAILLLAILFVMKKIRNRWIPRRQAIYKRKTAQQRDLFIENSSHALQSTNLELTITQKKFRFYIKYRLYSDY